MDVLFWEHYMQNPQVIVSEIFKGLKFLHPCKMLEQKEILVDFLNSTLHLGNGHKVVDLTCQFERPFDRFYAENKTFYFITTQDRRYLNVVLQNAHHAFFIDRSILNIFLSYNSLQVRF